MAGDADAVTAPGSDFRVRLASVGEAPAIAEIGVRAWQAAYRGLMPGGFLAGLSAAAREIAWRSLLESDEAGAAPTWVAELGNRTVGFAASGPPRDGDVPLPAAEVYAVYVLPEAWRLGAGRALLEAATNHWLVQGATTLVLWVLEANAPGRAFYEAMGWHADGASQVVDLDGFTAAEIRYRLGP